MSHRRQKVADRIREELGGLLRTVRDPRVGFVTLTDVEVSPDLSHGKVFVTILGDDDQISIDALNHAVPYLRRELAQRLGMRHTPSLRFFLDESIDRGFRIQELLDDLKEEHEPDGEGS